MLIGVAAAYCEADGARLCWRCDAAVHRANFLVARHIRALLCAACGGATPWRPAGPRLAPSKALCLPCLGIESSDIVDDGSEAFDDTSDVEEEEIEEQVVPGTAAAPSPDSSSSDGTDEILSYERRIKRRRDCAERKVDQRSSSPPPTKPSHLFSAQAESLNVDEATSLRLERANEPKRSRWLCSFGHSSG